MVEEEKNTSMNILSSPEKSVPKFCTGVAFNKLKNGDIVISFFHQNPTATLPPVLIETIITNEEHALKIAETLKTVIEKK